MAKDRLVPDGSGGWINYSETEEGKAAMQQITPETLMNSIAAKVHKNSIQKGFYESAVPTPERIALIHSEVSEALEADRNNKYFKGSLNSVNGWVSNEVFKSVYTNEVKGTFEEEIADILIRCFDLCADKNIDIDGHVKAKMRYNSLCEYKHGKKY